MLSSHFREHGIQRVHRPKAVALHLLSCKVRRHLLHRACNPVFRGKDGDVNPGKAGGRPLQRGGVRHIAPKKGQAPAAWKGRLCVLRVAGNAIDRCPFFTKARAAALPMPEAAPVTWMIWFIKGLAYMGLSPVLFFCLMIPAEEARGKSPLFLPTQNARSGVSCCGRLFCLMFCCFGSDLGCVIL